LINIKLNDEEHELLMDCLNTYSGWLLTQNVNQEQLDAVVDLNFKVTYCCYQEDEDDD
jgi:hypothetical protein